jgi:hypothetical protein
MTNVRSRPEQTASAENLSDRNQSVAGVGEIEPSTHRTVLTDCVKGRRAASTFGERLLLSRPP